MKKGFTIVETLVAITVLMIAISGPLTVSFRALNAAVASRDQMIASFLAQDAMEYARNIKDNNITDQYSEGWLETIGECTKTVKCPVDTTRSAKIEPDCVNFTDSKCRLYKDSTGKYNHAASSGSLTTPFYRTVYLQNIQSNTEEESAELVVDVLWTTGSYGLASTTFRTTIYNIAK
jgi:type II secretory pathway pseudopilin PulG